MSQSKDYKNLRVNKQEDILTNHPDTAIYISTSCDIRNSKKCLTDIEFAFKHGSGQISLIKMQNYVQKGLIRKTLLRESHSNVKKKERIKTEISMHFLVH